MSEAESGGVGQRRRNRRVSDTLSPSLSLSLVVLSVSNRSFTMILRARRLCQLTPIVLCVAIIRMRLRFTDHTRLDAVQLRRRAAPVG